MIPVFETQRLAVRRLTLADAPFAFDLVNTPNFVRFIGDKGVRDIPGAERYLREGAIASYEKHGFGLYLVLRKTDQQPLGITGLVKRDSLEFADLGYAFMPEHWGQGYASEAALGVLEYARNQLGIGSLLAITSPDNADSIKLLVRLGFRDDGMKELTPGDTIRLFSLGVS
ncbi:MAG: GNAT family N-acetyltransferase [Gemmatimonadota bacterium]